MRSFEADETEILTLFEPLAEEPVVAQQRGDARAKLAHLTLEPTLLLDAAVDLRHDLLFGRRTVRDA
jgi:hypothetical protein